MHNIAEVFCPEQVIERHQALVPRVKDTQVKSEVSYSYSLTDHVVGQSEVSYWVTLTDQMVSQSESQPLIDSSHWVARRLTNDQSYSQSIKPVKSPRYLTFHLISQFAGIMNNHIVNNVGQSLG